MKKASVPEIESLIAECRGNTAEIARRLHVSRGTIRNRIAESPKLQAAVEQARESYVDSVESALYENALDGNVAAQIFIMKAHPAAKRRGWGERQELTGPNGGPVEHEHTHHLAEVSDDDLRRNLAAFGRAALAASGRAPIPDDSGGVEGDDPTGEEA